MVQMVRYWINSYAVHCEASGNSFIFHCFCQQAAETLTFFITGSVRPTVAWSIVHKIDRQPHMINSHTNCSLCALRSALHVPVLNAPECVVLESGVWSTRVYFKLKISTTTLARDFKFGGAAVQMLLLAMVALTQKWWSAQFDSHGRSHLAVFHYCSHC